jgi:hypothetical protein
MASGTKRRQAELDAATTERNQSVAAARTPSPLEQYQDDRTLKTLQSLDNAKDVSEINGIAPYIDLFNRSRGGQQHNVGNFAFGQQYADPNLLAQQNQDRQGERETNASGMLEDAVAGIRSEATGSVLPLSQLSLSRSMGVLNSADNRFGNAQSAANQPPWYLPLITAAIGGGSSALGAYLGRTPTPARAP